jgi:hypothetical protein
MRSPKRTCISHLINGLGCLTIGFTCAAALGQPPANPRPETLPDIRAFAQSHLGPSALDEYDWQTAMSSKKSDTINALFTTVLHRYPKANELVYLTIHHQDGIVKEMLKHTVSFTDSFSRKMPSFIKSISFVCKGEAEQEIKSTTGTRQACPTRPYPPAVTISSVYKKGKVEPVAPTTYYLVQGAFQKIPLSCQSSFTNETEWLTGWNSILNPLHHMQNQ